MTNMASHQRLLIYLFDTEVQNFSYLYSTRHPSRGGPRGITDPERSGRPHRFYTGSDLYPLSGYPQISLCAWVLHSSPRWEGWLDVSGRPPHLHTLAIDSNCSPTYPDSSRGDPPWSRAQADAIFGTFISS